MLSDSEAICRITKRNIHFSWPTWLREKKLKKHMCIGHRPTICTRCTWAYNGVIHSIQVSDSCKEIQPCLYCTALHRTTLHQITFHYISLHYIKLRYVPLHTRNADKHTWMFNVVERVVIAFLAERSQGLLH